METNNKQYSTERVHCAYTRVYLNGCTCSASVHFLHISYSAVKVHVLVQIKVSGCTGFIGFLCAYRFVFLLQVYHY